MPCAICDGDSDSVRVYLCQPCNDYYCYNCAMKEGHFDARQCFKCNKTKCMSNFNYRGTDKTKLDWCDICVAETLSKRRKLGK